MTARPDKGPADPDLVALADEIDREIRALPAPTVQAVRRACSKRLRAAPTDRWWRRAALVSTVPLNLRSRGGTGDSARTLAPGSAARSATSSRPGASSPPPPGAEGDPGRPRRVPLAPGPPGRLRRPAWPVGGVPSETRPVHADDLAGFRSAVLMNSVVCGQPIVGIDGVRYAEDPELPALVRACYEGSPWRAGRLSCPFITP